MTDVKYNYNWVLDAKAQREAAPIRDMPKGIAAKPDGEGFTEEQGFLERMYDRLVSGFADEEEAINAMSGKKPSREAAQSSVLAELEALTIPKDMPTPTLDFYAGQDIDAKVDGEIAAESLRGSMPDTSSIDVPDYKVYSSPEEMSDLEILARTIEAEAASESYEGRVAVGAVIANRAASGSMGKGIKGVILKKGQFSPWNSYTGYAKGEQGKDMLRLKPSESSYEAAKAILTGDYEDKTKGATHYLNPDVSKPDWLPDMKSRKRGTVSIGRHLFGNADNNKTYDGKAWIRDRQDKV